MYDYDRRTASRKIFLEQVRVGDVISLYNDPAKFTVKKVKHNRLPKNPTEEDLEDEFVFELEPEGTHRKTHFNGPSDMTVTSY